MERSDKQRVLVVDDDREIVAAIVRLLEREGIEAIPAYNGREAVERLTENEIHLIIIDIMMPEMDGISATIKIRTERNIPVIMLSAKTEESDKILGLSVGADDYVTKPFSPAELIARVKSQLYDPGRLCEPVRRQRCCAWRSAAAPRSASARRRRRAGEAHAEGVPHS